LPAPELYGINLTNVELTSTVPPRVAEPEIGPIEALAC